MNKVTAFLNVSRVEFMPSAITQVGIPALLALHYIPFSSQFLNSTLVGLVVWWLGHWIGCHSNCLSDYEVDQKFKNHLPTAVDTLGKKNLQRILSIETIAASAFVIILSYNLQKPLLDVFWFVGLGLGLGYSVLPLRLKGRGFWNPFALSMTVFILPMLFVYDLLRPVLDLFSTVVIFLFVLHMVPLFFVDEVSDFEEDRDMNIGTPCVRYGRAKVTRAAIIIYLVAIFITVSVFLSTQVYASHLALGLVPLIVAGYAKVILDLFQLYRSIRQFEATNDPASRASRVDQIKRKVQSPVWLISTGIAVIGLVAGTLL